MLRRKNGHPMKSGRKKLIAEAEPGVCTPEAFLTRVKGISPFTTGQTLMVVWKSKIQSTKPRIRKRVVTKKGAILEKIKEVARYAGTPNRIRGTITRRGRRAAPSLPTYGRRRKGRWAACLRVSAASRNTTHPVHNG